MCRVLRLCLGIGQTLAVTLAPASHGMFSSALGRDAAH